MSTKKRFLNSKERKLGLDKQSKSIFSESVLKRKSARLSGQAPQIRFDNKALDEAAEEMERKQEKADEAGEGNRGSDESSSGSSESTEEDQGDDKSEEEVSSSSSSQAPATATAPAPAPATATKCVIICELSECNSPSYLRKFE